MGSVSKAVFFEHVRNKSQNFKTFEKLPHFPPIEDAYYQKHAEIPEHVYRGKLEGFLKFFSPASVTDAALLKAMVITLFWGGPGGSRPVFCLLGPEDDPRGGRGVGKSTITDMMNLLIGITSVDINGYADRDLITKRLLTAEVGTRVVRLDNLKKLSNDDLESLVTNDNISGHKMFVGNHSIPNLFTWVLTYNQPEFSEDMAERAIPIRLARPAYSHGWAPNIRRFVKENRWLIVLDCLRLLQRTPLVTLTEFSRYGEWSHDVLSKCTLNENIIGEIFERQTETLNEVTEIDLIRDIIDEKLFQYTFGGGMNGVPYDRENACYRVLQSLIFKWVKKEMPGMTSPRLTKLLLREKPDWLCLPERDDNADKQGRIVLGPRVKGYQMLDIGSAVTASLWVVDQRVPFAGIVHSTQVRHPTRGVAILHEVKRE